MDVAGEYVFDAPRDLVWAAIQDPEVLGTILPGGEGIEAVGENEFAGQLKIKVGPVQGKFKGHIELSDVVAPESYKITVDGKGAPGFVKAQGSLKLTEQGDQTHCDYEGTARIGGRIASVGQRLLDSSVKSIIRQSLEALNQYLKVQVAQRHAIHAAEVATDSKEVAKAVIAAASTPEYVPPTELQLAANVAVDVFNDMVPEEYRPIVVAGVIGLILVIVNQVLGFIFSFGRRR